MAATPIRIAIAGANGRMGQALAAVATGRSDLVVAARFDRPEAPQEGLQPMREALVAADVVIDFTTAEASTELAQVCAEAGVPAMVIGSTGLSPEQIAIIDGTAKRMAVMRSGNYSLGINLLVGLVAQAARGLPAVDWDVEIFEAHHKRKIDAPSGTALMLGEGVAAARGVKLADVAHRVGEGITGARPEGLIEFSVMRAGGIVGDHSVTFASEDEILTLSHSARDRSLFARGALAAARWVAGRPPGVYDMQDVLGMKG